MRASKILGCPGWNTTPTGGQYLGHLCGMVMQRLQQFTWHLYWGGAALQNRKTRHRGVMWLYWARFWPKCWSQSSRKTLIDWSPRFIYSVYPGRFRYLCLQRSMRNRCLNLESSIEPLFESHDIFFTTICHSVPSLQRNLQALFLFLNSEVLGQFYRRFQVRWITPNAWEIRIWNTFAILE